MAHEDNPVDFPTNGRWRGAVKTPGDSTTLGNDAGVFVVHAALMHTGRILMFSGRVEGAGYLYRSWSWDPKEWEVGNEAGAFDNVIGRWFLPSFDPLHTDHPPAEGEEPPVPTWEDNQTIDLFCSHHVALEDGKVLTVGGAGGVEEGDAKGNTNVRAYDPVAEKWQEWPSLHHGRWYPTAVLMPDGRVTVFSGRPKDGGGYAVEEVEILGPPYYTPQIVSGADRAMFIYPCMFLVPGGRVFYVPTAWAYEISSKDLTAGTADRIEDELKSTGGFRMVSDTDGVWEPAPSHSPRILPDHPLREEGSAVLLPPARDGKVLLIGGGAIVCTDRDEDDRCIEWTLHSESRPRSCEILDTQGSAPTWSPAGDMHHPRVNVHTVLLPDGKVLILGGHDRYKRQYGSVSNRAEIYDPSVPYDSANPSAAFTEVAEAHQSRLYHGVALLLPDGRVWTAGGEDHPGGTGNTANMEFYEPPYLHMGTQPVITSIERLDGPDDQIAYGGHLVIEYGADDGATIDKVVLMRPGSTTHHTDSEQRYEDIPFTALDGGRLLASIPTNPSVLPPGYYMLWIIDDQGRPCESAWFVRLSHEHCRLVTDKSHYSKDEYDAITVGGGSIAEFENAMYVVIHGFIPSEIGITTTSPSVAQLGAWAPAVTVTDQNGDGVSFVQPYPTAMHLEVAGDSLDTRQAITLEYGMRFVGDGMFPTEGDDDAITLRLTTSKNGYTCGGEIALTREPNPYMLDMVGGNPHWLSVDVRVFAVKAGGNAPDLSDISLASGSPDPTGFLEDVLNRYNSLSDTSGHPFNNLPTDQDESRLHLATESGGTRVFNFAVAKLRYRGLNLTATDVRLFFRMFTTAATSLEYQADTYPRRTSGVHVLSELGQNATDILTIPFYAAPRASINSSGDPLNVKTLAPDPGGAEIHEYCGAWLDFNDTTPRFVDPEDGVTKSIQDLIRGEHQCLVAEIHYPPDPIAEGSTPANHDNLSQRNLAILQSDNPGGPESHTVLHTFDIRPKVPKHVAATAPGLGVDSLMILWGGVPPDSKATLFIPQLDADEIVTIANEAFGATTLERVDAHTVSCHVADVTYVPLPANDLRSVAGLLTVELPDSVVDGERYRVEVHQVTTMPEKFGFGRGVGMAAFDGVEPFAAGRLPFIETSTRVVGTFEVKIVVSLADRLLAREAETLAVMKHIAGTISPSSRWYLIFQRYLAGLSGRVRGFGGDPTAVPPSPHGHDSGGRPPGGRPDCPPDDCKYGPHDHGQIDGRILRWLAAVVGVKLVLMLLRRLGRCGRCYRPKVHCRC